VSLLPIRIGLSVVGLGLIFTSGYIAGRQHGRVATLQAAVVAYQNREKINHEVQNLDPVALCRAVGGMPDQCADLLLGLHETTQSP